MNSLRKPVQDWKRPTRSSGPDDNLVFFFGRNSISMLLYLLWLFYNFLGINFNLNSAPVLYLWLFPELHVFWHDAYVWTMSVKRPPLFAADFFSHGLPSEYTRSASPTSPPRRPGPHRHQPPHPHPLFSRGFREDVREGGGLIRMCTTRSFHLTDCRPTSSASMIVSLLKTCAEHLTN